VTVSGEWGSFKPIWRPQGDSHLRGRKKKSAPSSATPTKEQLIAELESLDTVQARIDCIAADIGSKKNRYDALDAYELGELIDLEDPSGWLRCHYASKGHQPSFQNANKPVANYISAIEFSVPKELYPLLERKAKAIINSTQSSDLTIADIVNTIAKGLPEVHFEVNQSTVEPEVNPWPFVPQEEPSFSETLESIYSDSHNTYTTYWTQRLSDWVESDLLPNIRERYRKEHPARNTSDADDEERILAIRGFGPKEFFSLLRRGWLADSWELASDLMTLPTKVLNRAIRSVKVGNPEIPKRTLRIQNLQEWFESEFGGPLDNDLRRLVEKSLMPLLEESYYEEYPRAHPDWDPEGVSDIALAFISVKASDGTQLHFEVLSGDEAWDMRSPYDIEAGNGHDMSNYVDVS